MYPRILGIDAYPLARLAAIVGGTIAAAAMSRRVGVRSWRFLTAQATVALAGLTGAKLGFLSEVGGYRTCRTRSSSPKVRGRVRDVPSPATRRHRSRTW